MIENPAVNRFLADKAFDHMDHALGRPLWPLRDAYRNKFATNGDGHLAAEFDRSPHWEKTMQDGDMAFYHVNDAGKQALAEYLAKHDPHRAFVVTWDGHSEVIPATTPAKAKYKYYLAISDVMPDIDFVDFSNGARVRRAA